MSILFIVLILLFIVTDFMGTIPSRPHANIILENTLPKDKLNAPIIKSLVKEYRKGLLFITIIFSILAIPMLFIPYDSILMTVFMLLTFGNIATFYLYQVHYIHKLHDLQAKMGWLLQAQPVLIDTKTIMQKNRKMLSFNWLWGSLSLTLAAIIISAVQLKSFTLNLILSGSALLLWGICLLMFLLIRRFPVKAWSQQEELNQQYNDVTKFYWSFVTVILSYVFIPIILLPYVSLSFSSLTVNIVSIAYFIFLFASCGIIVGLLFTLRKKQDQVMAQSGEQRYTGDDQYWRYGIYYNPNDNRWMIPDRIGMNITVNLAKPAMKIIGIITGVLTIGLLIFVTVPLYKYDFQTNSIKLSLTNSEVIMTAPFVGTSTVELSDIEAVELVDDLPNNLIKTNGMATDRYATGSFSSNGRPATLYVRREQEKIIFLQTAERDYYFTGKSANETQEEYQKILSEID